jgi:hypothetical protein
MRGDRILCVLSVSLGAVACSSSSSPNACSGPTSFQVFQTSEATSSIPLCTDATVAGPSEPPQKGATFGYAPFAGAPTLSSAGLAQCSAICASAIAPLPCCRSQWLAQTIVCSPNCQ